MFGLLIRQKVSIMKRQKEENKELWDKHWGEKSPDYSMRERFASLYRDVLISREVSSYFDKYFPHKGVLLECGSGTSQTSRRIKKYHRSLIAVDFSRLALLRARENNFMDDFVESDITKMPFSNGSIDGIYNVGVMEHFTETELITVLNEFNRVLNNSGCCLLFWPQKYNWVKLIPLKLFPTSPSCFDKKMLRLFTQTGFYKMSWHISPVGGFLHCVVVAYKK